MQARLLAGGLYQPERLWPLPAGATARTMSAAGATAERSRFQGHRRVTYQDVLDTPPHLVAEIVDGTLYTHPRLAPPHVLVSSPLGIELGVSFGKGRGAPGGYWIIGELELHLGEDVLVPDLAGWHRERMTAVAVVD